MFRQERPKQQFSGDAQEILGEVEDGTFGKEYTEARMEHLIEMNGLKLVMESAEENERLRQWKKSNRGTKRRGGTQVQKTRILNELGFASSSSARNTRPAENAG